jgi:hypothetical protein
MTRALPGAIAIITIRAPQKRHAALLLIVLRGFAS